ncbi:alpha/beta fold hydrolase [Mycobacterium sp. 3519A]|uniref:alpha/beta fold hydrolase n=1 Tax=Mycobacterium sp. 3519A TaxID=2057184 RepID=UPI000C7E6B3E|nr:alpha/beta hydrolase [Mycobacterium sp. 3519A]
MKGLLGLVFAVVVLAGCAGEPRPANFSGLVDIGNGRHLFLTCRGAGAPTVFIIPGKGSHAAAWRVVVSAVATTTSVCAYDRPNTRRDGDYLSTPVPQPHSVAQAVSDVVKLVGAARLSTPMVVVAHSYGGLIADLLARTHPGLVSGLVLVDPTSEYLPRLGRAEQDARFDQAARTPAPDADGEGFLADDAFATLRVAPPLPLPRMPAIVLSADVSRGDMGAGDYTKYQVHRANSLLAETLWTDNVIVGGSGHNMMLSRPSAVAAKTLAMVDWVRSGVRRR